MASGASPRSPRSSASACRRGRSRSSRRRTCRSRSSPCESEADGHHLHVEGDVVVQVHRVELRHVPYVVQQVLRRKGLGREPRRERLARLPPRGKRAGEGTEDHMVGHGPETGGVFPAAVVGDAAVIVMRPSGDAVRHGHGLVAAGAEERHLLPYHGQERRVFFEICVHRLFKIRESDLLLVEDQLLDDHEGIGDVGQTDDGGAGAVVYRAALGDILSFVDAPVNERREERRRTQILVRFRQHVVVLDGLVDEKLELRGKGIEEIIECLEVALFHIAGIRARASSP